VALSKGLTGDLEPLLGIQTPVRAPETADAAIFYSINNCLRGLHGVPFGNFLIKQVVAELAAEFSNIQIYGTLSPLPSFSQALRDEKNEEGFTHERLSCLLADHARALIAAGRRRDPLEALFHLLEQPLAHRDVLARPLERLALAYLTQARLNGRLYDPVATFHLSNGARLERINTFGNLRPYGLRDSFGVTVNYRYLPDDLEENHERFVRGEIQVANNLLSEYKSVAKAWQQPEAETRVSFATRAKKSVANLQ
jgi:malonyl-CoA decarboxylase